MQQQVSRHTAKASIERLNNNLRAFKPSDRSGVNNEPVRHCVQLSRRVSDILMDVAAAVARARVVLDADYAIVVRTRASCGQSCTIARH